MPFGWVVALSELASTSAVRGAQPVEGFLAGTSGPGHGAGTDRRPLGARQLSGHLRMPAPRVRRMGRPGAPPGHGPTAAPPRRSSFRTRQQFAAILTGLDLVEPGLVTLTDWHPEPGMTSLARRRRRNTRGRPSAECLADQVIRRPPGAGDSRESVPPASTRRARLVSVATSSAVSAAKNSPVTSATISSASASLSQPRGVTARM